MRRATWRRPPPESVCSSFFFPPLARVLEVMGGGRIPALTAARQRLDSTGLSGFPPYGGDYSIIATCRSTGVCGVWGFAFQCAATVGATVLAVPLCAPLATACAAHFVRGILLLTRVALTRPSIRRVFLRSPCARRRFVDSLTFARGRKRTLPLTGNVAILAAHPEQPSTYPPKTSQLSLPNVSFSRRKIFYDLRLDLRFVW